MAETQAAAEKRSNRATQVGEVVSTKMQKTIVVEVRHMKAHPLYRRVVKSSRKFYAHDEQNSAHVGDVVRIEETRPMSKLKRWRLKDILRRATIVPQEEEGKKQAS